MHTVSTALPASRPLFKIFWGGGGGGGGGKRKINRKISLHFTS